MTLMDPGKEKHQPTVGTGSHSALIPASSQSSGQLGHRGGKVEKHECMCLQVCGIYFGDPNIAEEDFEESMVFQNHSNRVKSNQNLCPKANGTVFILTGQ